MNAIQGKWWQSSALLIGLSSLVGCTYDPPSTGTTGGNGGAGGGSGGISVGGAGGGGGSQGNKEDCQDGQDNDSDGAIDCADSDCVPGYQCVPIAPPGSGEYVRIARTTGEANVIPCSLDGSMPVIRGTTPVQPACTACECTVSNVNCRQEVIELYSDMACSNLVTTINATSGCVPITPVAQGSYWMSINEPTGDVSTSTSIKMPEQPWQNVVHVCPAHGNSTGTGCGEGEFCVPRVKVPYEARMCVQAPGDISCGGQYSEKITAYDGVGDSRGCSPCDCSATLQCSGYMGKLDSGMQCDGMMEQSAGFDQCFPIGSGVRSIELTMPTWQVIEKIISGGEPTGAVTPSSPRTFCCTP